ncbi:hypothetical protein A9W96_16405 [Mycobacterium sp. 1245852.3]|nr:hypothetical protein A9W96_16405 [Mycobacterium sp. 1245852.3]
MIAWRVGPADQPTAIPGHPMYVAPLEDQEVAEFNGAKWQVARKVKGVRFGVDEAGFRHNTIEFADGTPDLKMPKGSQVVWLTFL